jgi:hypothetical protein
VTSVVSVQQEAPQAERVQPRVGFGAWGWLPVVSLIGACGLLLVAFADGLSRDGRAGATVVFWIGLLAIVVPAAVRLASRSAERRERIAVVVMTGVLLYLVKVVRDPYAFTFADELVHLHNANEIVRRHALFGSNAILAVTPHYPGLEAVTAALASLSGLSTLVSGLVVVGAARLLLVLALYLLFERISGSALVAGLASLVYAASPNFLYFSAQFSYESLAVPLAAMAVLAAAHVAASADSERRAWILIGALVVAAAVVTHHLTSYALAAFLTIICLVYLVRRRDVARSAPWELAVVAIGACIAWLTLVAPSTITYLSPVFTHAFSSIGHTISGKTAIRTPLKSHAGTGSSSPVAYVVSVLFVVLVAVGVLFGIRTLWRRHRRDPFALVLGGMALAYLLVLPLRFFSGAWEIANRSSEFLFVGVAFLLGLAALERWQPRGIHLEGRTVLAGCTAVLFAGGAIIGWPARLLLARPDRVSAGGRTIEAQGFAAARWSLAALGPFQNIVADTSNGRLLLVYANENALVGKHANARGIIRTFALRHGQIRRIRRDGIRYVLVDRRQISWDARAGYFFSRGVSPTLFPVKMYEKFDRQPAVSRIFDSGNIAIYDVTGLWTGAPRK